ncbi:MAG: alkaline phosphatase D family protein [Agitococcus sp.]
MNRRELLKKAGFLTTSVAVFGLAACSGNEDDPVALPFLKKYRFPQGVMAADPKPDSIILWTRVVPPDYDDIKQIPSNNANVKVMLEVSMDANFSELLAVPVSLLAQAQYDNTIRHKLTGLNPATSYYYRFRAEAGLSRVGRFKTAPAVNADVNSLNFAFMACQDWSVNHWVGLSALAKHNLDFVVHLGDYIYEAAGDSYQAEKVEGLHDKIVMPSNTRKPNNPDAQIAVTTEDYRYLYKKYRSDARLQDLHARFAIIAVWDDHEFSDDCWQNNETYTNGSVTVQNGLPLSPAQLTGTDTTSQTTRRRSANRAWFEFMPADIPALDESAADNFKTVKIYRDLQFGKLAHFIMTDQRLYRADHIIPEAVDNPLTPATDQLGSIGSRYFVPEDTHGQVQQGKMIAAIKGAFDSLANTDANKLVLGGMLTKLLADATGSTLTAEEKAIFNEVGLALVSVLGETQRNWWKSKMASSTATWKFWGNEVSLLRMALNLKVIPAVVAAGEKNPVLKAMINSYLINADQWDGYSAERANLMGFLTNNNIKNVVAVTGDIHAFYAGEVPANYANYEQGKAAMVDLVTAGISSSSFWSYLASVVGDFETEVTAVKTARTANPTTYTNSLESGANPFAALRQMVYTSINMLIYDQVKATILATADLSTTEKQQAAYRQIFEVYLTKEVAVALGGYAPINTLNETFAGNMGQTIQAVSQQLGVTIPNPYTGVASAPPIQNPWIKFVESNTQGFITVNVTAARVEAKYHHIETLAKNPSADTVIAASKTKTVVVNNGSTQLSIS